FFGGFGAGRVVGAVAVGIPIAPAIPVTVAAAVPVVATIAVVAVVAIIAATLPIAVIVVALRGALDGFVGGLGPRRVVGLLGRGGAGGHQVGRCEEHSQQERQDNGNLQFFHRIPPIPGSTGGSIGRVIGDDQLSAGLVAAGIAGHHVDLVWAFLQCHRGRK